MKRKKTLKQLKNESENEIAFDYYFRCLGKNLPVPEKEFKFSPTRNWRFDRSWPKFKLAVELDGVVNKGRGGKHNSSADREKLNAAAILGWVVLRYTHEQLFGDPVSIIDAIRRFLLDKGAIENGCG